MSAAIVGPVTLAAFLAAGCGATRPAHDENQGLGPSPVEMREPRDRPGLSLVSRQGDPFSAVALAVAHDLGATASLWLEALLQDRLERATSLALESRPSGNGFVIRARVESPEQATRFVVAIRNALSAPIAIADFSRTAARVASGPAPRSWTNDAERAVGDCVAELGTKPVPQPTAADLDRFRVAIFTTRTVALAAVGPHAVLDATADALTGAAAWPSNTTLDDPWPPADVAGTLPIDPSGSSLSVAIRIADAARALDAAKTLGARGSELAVHVAALEPAWRVARVVGTTRPRGACVRVDLDALKGPVTTADATGTAALTLDEINRAVAVSPGTAWSLDRSVLESTDPRDSAAIAAWRALGSQLAAGPNRVFVTFGSGGVGAEASDVAFARSLGEARAARAKPSIELRRSVEGGQGETWMLLGSACASAGESTQTAGLAALTVRALAHETEELDGVRIEPWVSGDGIGLLAHGPRLGPNESAGSQTARIANALGRVVAATVVTDEDAAAARVQLQADLGPETELLWPVALEALAPKHPSLLDPRGTWQSITELPTHLAELQRRAFVRGPLRLAVIGNGAATDSDAAALAVDRWLRPERTQNVACPVVTNIPARSAQYEIDSGATPQGGTRALVAVPIPPLPGGGGIPIEAEWTALLLNRDNGWLDRSVRAPGLAVHAEATVLGGRDAAALAIEIVATGDKAREAASQARAVLARLSEGAATTEDLTSARAAFDRTNSALSVDPRHRVVALWRGSTGTPTPDLASLRKFHHDVLSPDRHVVVLPRAKP